MMLKNSTYIGCCNDDSIGIRMFLWQYVLLNSIEWNLTPLGPSIPLANSEYSHTYYANYLLTIVILTKAPITS